MRKPRTVPRVGETSKNAIGAALDAALGDQPQRSLAEKVGVTQSQVSRWVKGLDAIKPAQVFAIERALDLSPGTLSRLEGYLPLDAATGYVNYEEAIRAELPESSEELTGFVIDTVAGLISKEREKGRRRRK